MDDFNEYLNKYNDEMNNKDEYINSGADRSFLDRKEKPTDAMIIALFITEDDMKNAVDLTDYNISDLGNPDNIKSIEGTEWILSKLVWDKAEGRIITFDIVQLSLNIEDIANGNDGLINPLSGIIDVNFEDVISDFENYHNLMENAVDEEDFDEAVRLRDWLAEFKVLGNKLPPLIKKSINNENFKLYKKYINQLNNHINKL